MQKFILILIITFLYFSCKKERSIIINVEHPPETYQYDTVKIGDYFPVYPSSYWTYKNQNGDTITYKTSLDYQLFSNYHPYHNPYDTTKYFATLYNGKIVKCYKINKFF